MIKSTGTDFLCSLLEWSGPQIQNYVAAGILDYHIINFLHFGTVFPNLLGPN